MPAFSRRLLLGIVLAFPFTNTALAEDIWKTVPPPAELPQANERGTASVNDIQMYYEVWNSSGSDPVLLLHGGMGSTLNWGNQVPALIGKHKVIALDSRGHGRSTFSDQPFSYELMASDVLAMMDYLEIDKASIVGWSDGGIIGLVIAMEHPERINKLMTFGASYNLTGIKPTIESDPVVGMAMGLMMENYQKLSSTPENFENFMEQISVMWYSQPDFKPEQLAKITAPTLIADGQYDEFITTEHTTELAAQIPGAKLLIMPNVSHMAMWQNPEVFNAAMDEFLDSP